MPAEKPPRSLARSAVLLGLLVSAALVFMIQMMTNRTPPANDALYYVDMAEHGIVGNDHFAVPFAYRPAVPMIVRALHGLFSSSPVDGSNPGPVRFPGDPSFPRTCPVPDVSSHPSGFLEGCQPPLLRPELLAAGPHAFAAQIMILSTVIDRGIGWYELVYFLVALLLFNKIYSFVPLPAQDFYGYIEFYGGWPSLLTPKTLFRFLETTGIIAGANLLRILFRRPANVS